MLNVWIQNKLNSVISNGLLLGNIKLFNYTF